MGAFKQLQIEEMELDIENYENDEEEIEQEEIDEDEYEDEGEHPADTEFLRGVGRFHW